MKKFHKKQVQIEGYLHRKNKFPVSHQRPHCKKAAALFYFLFVYTF